MRATELLTRIANNNELFDFNQLNLTEFHWNVRSGT